MGLALQRPKRRTSSLPETTLEALVTASVYSTERGGTARVCCESSDPLGFLHMVGISSMDTGQETMGCAVSRALIVQERRGSLVCLSVRALSFYVHFGVHAVVFG